MNNNSNNNNNNNSYILNNSNNNTKINKMLNFKEFLFKFLNNNNNQ